VAGEFDRCLYFTGWKGTGTPRESAGLARGFAILGVDRLVAILDGQEARGYQNGVILARG
jgi:hypothetical protein